MFRKTAFKLAGLYLAVLMLISLFFSIVVYELSVQELERGLRSPDTFLDQLREDRLLPSTMEQLRVLREARYLEAKDRVLSRLIIINIIILSSGGLLSYFLALRTLKPIEAAHAALERFTADASHELRTPIAAMQSETEVALMDPKLTLSEAKRRLGSNLEELSKLTSLTEGLLKLARMEKSGLQKRQVPAAKLADEAISRVQPLAAKKQIMIKKADQPEVSVSVDKASFIEALVIILDNAVKYNQEGSEVMVKVTKHQKTVVIAIEDHGIGIHSDELPYIFDRFYRADAARSKQSAEGYGIGLAIAKDIVEMHDGHISVSSKPGKGSVFKVCVPL